MIAQRITGANKHFEKTELANGLSSRIEPVLFNGQIVHSMVSAWEPTPEELQALNAGASVELRIMGLSHPLVAITTGKVPE